MSGYLPVINFSIVSVSVASRDFFVMSQSMNWASCSRLARNRSCNAQWADAHPRGTNTYLNVMGIVIQNNSAIYYVV